MTPTRAPRPFNRRAALATLGLGVLAPNVLAACGGTTAKQAEKKEQAAPQLKYQPANATDNVVPIVPVSVEVSDGWFQHVTLSNSSGKAVAGAFNSDRTVYTTSEPLGYDQTYTWNGSAVGHDGKAVPVAGKFTTVSPTKKIGGSFQLGRGQVVKAEVPSHRIQVIRDEGVIMDFPCSYGEADKARNVTRNGIHVVSENYSDFYMSNPAAGYSKIHERWAVRISNNGEFIHANPASSGAQGNTNVTNGCINLSTGDAQQYYQSAIYGDPVEVTGSSIQLSYSDGDIWDWAVDWDTWVAMSALPPPSAHPPSTQIPVTAPVTPSNAPTLSGTPTTSTTPATRGPATPGG